MLNRWREIWAQKQLLFTPKQYPKYFNNKLRVFSPSNSLKASIVAVLVCSLWRLKEEVLDEEIIIEYPAQKGTPI